MNPTTSAILPPGSVVRLVKCPRGVPNKYRTSKIGKLARVGYYSKQDTTDIIWLVDQFGDYVETWEQASVGVYLEIVQLSNETDLFGDDRPRMRALENVPPEWAWSE